MFVAQRQSTMRPPPGRQQLSREFIAEHQRARIIAALAQEVAEKGYRAVTVADVVRRAGIARNTFYENFSSKEDCFLAAQEHATEEAIRRVVAAARAEEAWAERVDAGLSAFLAYIAEEPDLARTCIVEALSAGPAAIERYERSLQEFVPLFRVGREASAQGKGLPGTFEEALAGGIFWLVYQRIVDGEAATAEELRPQLLEFVLMPYLGAEESRRVASSRTQ